MRPAWTHRVPSSIYCNWNSVASLASWRACAFTEAERAAILGWILRHPVTPADLRSLFPHTDDMVYLDHAALGPLARPVVSAVDSYLLERGETNPGNHLERFGTVDRLRERVAQLVGAPAARVDLAPNTTYALNVMAMGFPWQRGDRVAIPSCEFPANAHPWLQLRRLGVEVDLVPHTRGVVSVEDIERTLTPRTRL